MKKLILAIFILTNMQVFAAETGKSLFKTCTACHSIGGGDKIGPDLAGLSKRRTVKWIVKFVNYPEGMINGDVDEEGYEKPDKMAKKVYNAYKPQMMAEQELSAGQIKKILKYIDGLKKKPSGKITKIK
jgi:mono/diheme cytochrome c family protein